MEVNSNGILDNVSFYEAPEKLIKLPSVEHNPMEHNKDSVLVHRESNVKVYWTTDYGIFKTISGNRQLNEAKIKRIKSDISRGLDVLKYCPIIVFENNGRLEIIDGQHRFYVAKQLKRNVWYIICDNLSLLDIAKINSNTDKWKDADFINCYSVNGNDNYIQLQEFIDRYNFPLTTSLSLLTHGSVLSGGGYAAGITKSDFRQGKFKIKQKDKAIKMAEKILLFQDFKRYKSGSFVQAICRIENEGKVLLEDVLYKYKESPEMLTYQNNAKEYLHCLELIYNKSAKIRKVIY